MTLWRIFEHLGPASSLTQRKSTTSDSSDWRPFSIEPVSQGRLPEVRFWGRDECHRAAEPEGRLWVESCSSAHAKLAAGPIGCGPLLSKSREILQKAERHNLRYATSEIHPVFSSLGESNLERYIAPVKNNKRNEGGFTTRDTRETIAALAIVATAALTRAGVGKPAYDHFFADAPANASAGAVRRIPITVLGSTGSGVPPFQRQLAADGPLSYEGKFIGSQARLLNGRQAPAAPASGLHPPYALVLGYVTPLAAGAHDADIAG